MLKTVSFESIHYLKSKDIRYMSPTPFKNLLIHF